MGQQKLVRFEAIKGFQNVLQYPENMAGRWAAHFGNGQPLTLELACGKGEYTVGLATLHPEQNFIGVDVKGNRIFIGARQAIQQQLNNAAFLRTQIDRIATYFNPQEVASIWITFPDPQLRRSRAKRRLTHPKFLRLYQRFLQKNGDIHLKTDSPVLYRFTLQVIEKYGCTLKEALDNLYADQPVSPELNIKTHYESLDIAGSNRVHYIRFSLPDYPLPDFDKALQEYVFANEAPTGNEKSIVS
ncbi:MAG TPA: tRNA (guanosine(46)-N7)-methyltransferase TrmB [Flavihumibacter sp.]|nr:tRNA (guanosine(46)-N7)-methyltransferase TrmB [Bacteroidota bacterium]HPZ88639.1 tRNA (guanosine(46)-N7)-methyltransferase TrmB [Flavihumibacter sp.]HQD10359.1 tRNA (guanosine(46)-N7)-methyltransferase TrmB [Flavihumibacter sp.]